MKIIGTRHYTAEAAQNFQIDRVKLFQDVPSERSGPYLYDHVTAFQIAIQTPVNNPVNVFIPWAELTPVFLRERSLFMKYDSVKNRWVEISSSHTKTGWKMTLQESGVYALAYNLHQELSIVDEVVSGFPNWYAGRQDRNSNMRRLTNALMSSYLPIESGIEEMAAMANLFAIDESMLSQINRYVAPELISVDRARVLLNKSGFYQELEQAESVEDLLFDVTKEKVLIDFRRGEVLSLEPYTGVEVEIDNGTNKQLFKTSPRDEKLWNTFDEIGLIYGMKRLYKETNLDFKRRLSTLFSHPGNATKTGVLFEIARQLGNIVHKDWIDDTKGFLVTNPTGQDIIVESIQVDGNPAVIEWQPDGGFLILPTGTRKPREVVWFYGVKGYRPDRDLGDETGLLSMNYNSIYGEVANKAPLLYGQAKWGIQEWDMTIDEGLIEWFGAMDEDSQKWKD